MPGEAACQNQSADGSSSFGNLSAGAIRNRSPDALRPPFLLGEDAGADSAAALGEKAGSVPGSFVKLGDCHADF